MARDMSLYRVAMCIDDARDRYDPPGYCFCEECACVRPTDDPAGFCDDCADGNHGPALRGLDEPDACSEHPAGCGDRPHTRFAEAP